jgi:hypothetical protein
MPRIAFYSGHHGAQHRQVDLVLTTVQHLIGVCQYDLAMCTGHRLGGHRLVGIAGHTREPSSDVRESLRWL